MKFKNTIKFKLSALSLTVVIVPLIIIGSLSYILSRNSLIDISKSEIKNTIEGGYNTFQIYYDKVQNKELTKKQALNEIRKQLSGPIKKISITFNSIGDFSYLLNQLKIKGNADITSGNLYFNKEKVGVSLPKANLYEINDPVFVNKVHNSYNELSDVNQRLLMSGTYKMRLTYDISKAILKIRDDGYIFAIEGNPKTINKNTAFEVLHPYVRGVDVYNAKNSDGEQVGKNISIMKHKIDSVGANKIILYEYKWKNPSDPYDRKKIVMLKYFKPWNLVVATGLYEDEYFAYLKSTRNIYIVGVLFFGAVFYIIFYLYSNKLMKRIKHLKDVAREIESGNLNAEVNVGGKDEITGLAISIQKLQAELRKIVEELIDKSNQLAASAEEISTTIDSFSQNSQNQASSTEEIAATVEEVTAGIENIADNAVDQFHNMETLMNRIDELTTAIGDTEKSIRTTLSHSKDIEDKATVGQGSLRDMNKNMTNIINSSQDMMNIVAMINDISEQINLLSLNAAIEAARAGEAGKGFAVVADEIAKLADQTFSSTQEIDNLIRANNDEIDKGRHNVKETIELISSVIGGVENINNMMNKITDFINNQIKTNREVNTQMGLAKDKANHIKIDTEEKRAAFEEISKSIATINYSIQSIAQGSEELLANSEEIAGMAEELRGGVDVFKL